MVAAIGRGSRLAPFASSSESSTTTQQPRLLAKQPGELDRYAEEQSVVSSRLERIEPPQVVEEEPDVEEEFPAQEVGTAGKLLNSIEILTKYSDITKVNLSVVFFRSIDQSIDQLCSSHCAAKQGSL